MRRILAAVATVTVAGVLSSAWPTVAAAQDGAAAQKRVSIEDIAPIDLPNGSANLEPGVQKMGDFTVPSADGPKEITYLDRGERTEFDPAKELVGERTATSAVSELDDGTRVVRFFDEPAYYPSGKGFVPIDNSVIPHPTLSRVLVSKANSWRVTFAPLGAGG